MKKILLLTLLFFAASFSLSAQVRVQSPHPDLDVKIESCKYINESVQIKLIITNYSSSEDIEFLGSQVTPWEISAKAYDNEGLVYTRGSSYNSATSSISIGVGGGKQTDKGKSYTIPTNQPVAISVIITKACSYATRFERIDLPLRSKGSMRLSADYPLRIYNLEWTK